MPLNDGGVTLLATQEAPLLELLSRVPTLRCTWGVPGPSGIVSNISLVDASQSRTVEQELVAAGFGCDEASGTTTCSIEQRGVSLDDTPYVRGETHTLAGDLWIATSWVNADINGYNEDVIDTLSR